MNAFKAARESVAAALADVQANVYEYPPELVASPAVVLVVDEPMAEPLVIGSRLRFAANYKLMVCVAPMTNLGSLEAVEALVIEVLAALPVNVLVGPVTAPNVTQVGQSDLVVCEIPLQVQTEES
jgi:hypothetical protein